MRSVLTELLERIHALEEELDAELTRRRERFRFTLRDKTVRFEHDVLQAQKALRVGLYRYLRGSSLLSFLTAPVIYSLIVPIALLDLGMTVYQWLCFPAYGIPRVERGPYLALDRHHLAYLNAIERVNCLYCAYGNGVLAYATEIASRTEQYWCPIKHARKVVAAHKRYVQFLEYGDAEGYRARLADLRAEVRSSEAPPPQGAPPEPR
ncbi:MAG: hypothetical protein HY423_03500 [Candidatus Lambdaproteobacteria bacterium]|nr:hypothetical protein [Candidatus Lambdaproteobacteria bacterium]